MRSPRGVEQRPDENVQSVLQEGQEQVQENPDNSGAATGAATASNPDNSGGMEAIFTQAETKLKTTMETLQTLSKTAIEQQHNLIAHKGLIKDIKKEYNSLLGQMEKKFQTMVTKFVGMKAGLDTAAETSLHSAEYMGKGPGVPGTPFLDPDGEGVKDGAPLSDGVKVPKPNKEGGSVQEAQKEE